MKVCSEFVHIVKCFEGGGMAALYHGSFPVFPLPFHHTPSPSGLPLSQGEKVGNNAQPSLSL